ncbi:hypothetical protein L596_007001 [Steinernema carpocapsae]|nr:hypothetical protein L596_007001 [Steinernema carpocapsae]
MAMRKRSMSNGTISTDDQRRLIRERIMSNGSLIINGQGQPAPRRTSKQMSLQSSKSLDIDKPPRTGSLPPAPKSRPSIMNSYKPSLTILSELEKKPKKQPS